MSKTKILIATPALARTVTIDYMVSIRFLEVALRQAGIDSDVAFTIGSVLARGRAALASRILHDQSYSHLLFIDNDMSFKPSAVLKLLNHASPFCGCLYPHRRTDYTKLYKSARSSADPVEARNIGQNYVGHDRIQVADDREKTIPSKAGFVKVDGIGFGLTLIQRSALERMKARFPELVLAAGVDPAYVAMGARYEILQAFESLQMPGGLFLGEDLSFSRRWIEGCGGEIWACVDEEIGHVGMSMFTGRMSDLLQHEGFTLRETDGEVSGVASTR